MQVKLNKIVAMLYSILAVALSLPPLFFIFKQDTFRLGIFVIAYVITAILALKLKERSLPLVALMAFLLGWLKTSWSGFDIDPGSGLLVLAAGIFIFGLTRKVELKINLAELMLLVIAGIALVSMLFTLVKIASFSPVPGLGYMNYSVNSFGLASDDLIIQVTRVTSVIFSLFGLLVAGRRFSFEKDRFLLFSSVSILVLINSGILFYQKFVDSAFLSPVGIPFDGRFSGATSFCYALSSGVEILILSIPLWFIIKNKWLAASSTLVGALLLYSLNLSGSRTALFVSAGFLLCWGYYAFMQQVKGKSVSQKIAINLGIFVILGAIVTGVYLAIPEDTSSSLGRLKVYSSQEGGFFGHLIDTRLEHYRVSIPMVLERPLAGIGLGTYYSEARKYADLNIENYNPWDAYGVSSNVSNMYLGMAVEMGLPAAILFVFWVIVVLATPRKEDVPQVQYFALKAGMLVYSLGLLVGPQLLNTEACGWTMLFAGAILSYGKRPEKELPAKHIAIPVAIVALLAFTGHFLSDYDNAMFKQWKKLQWHQENGWYPQEQDGRWTTLRSTMGIKQGNILDIQWRSALPASPENQRQNIKFYLDDELILSTVATDDRERRFTYYLSDNFNKGALLTVLVDRPFIPSNHFDTDDQRELGIFIKSLKVKTSLQMPVGFYPPEVDADGREFMWSRRESALQLNSSKENKLLLRSLSEKREVNLAVFVNNSFMKNVVLTPGWKELSISPDKLEGKLKDRLGETYLLSFRHEGSVSPKELGLGDDDRELIFALQIRK